MAAKNRPTTGIAHQLEEGIILVSRTDKKGKIQDANRPFIRVSGYTESELIGAPHSLVRHPDMPKEAFADLWKKLKEGRPWHGFVKNRCKNGDHYWVEANVSPRYENGSIVGYLSVRSKPSDKHLHEAEKLYKEINAGKASFPPKGFFITLKNLWRDTAFSKLLSLLFLPLLALFWGSAFIPLSTAASAVLMGIATVYCFSLVVWASQRLIKPIKQCSDALLEMSEENFQAQFDIERNDDVGKLFQSLKIMQNSQRASIAKERAMNATSIRFRQSLESAQSSVMMVDADLNIIYVNPSLHKLLSDYEKKIKVALPHFSMDSIIGTNIDTFHKDPSHQRRILESLNTTYSTEIHVGELTLTVIATPIFSDEGKRLGIVTEWRDRTTEVAVEDEIKGMVAAIRQGDLSRHISLENKSGFFLALCEEINEMIQVIASSFEDIAQAMKSVSKGDLTLRITTERDGKYADIQNDINATVDHLKDTIDQVIRASDFFKKASEQIVSGNSDLSNRTDEQAATLQETAAAMSQMTDTVKSNAENAVQANTLATEAQQTAERGGEVVKQAVLAMEEINQSSEKIDEITGVIDEIAFQTNLLALNASVEAARAGSHGQGFAVVATEVRSLASRSAQAAKEIKELIADSGLKVQNGSQLVLNSGETLTDIVKSVSQVGSIISEIATASSEQSAGLHEINQAVVQLDDMTQKNAALAESVTGSSKESHTRATEIVKIVEFFKT